MSDSPWPMWLQDIRTTLGVTPQYVLWGNVHDVHLVPGDGDITPLSTTAALWEVAQEAGLELILHFDPVDGVAVLPQTEEARQKAAALFADARLTPAPADSTPLTPTDLGRLLRAVVTHGATRAAIVIRRPARLSADITRPDADLLAFFATAERLAGLPPAHAASAARRRTPNTVFWVLDREQDAPHWLVADNAGLVRTVVVPKPDRETRRRYAASVLGIVPDAQALGASQREEAAEDIADRCDGMALSEILAVLRLAKDQGLPLHSFDTALRAYRIGAVDSPWRKDYLRERIIEAETSAGIRARVRGQEAAVTTALDILKRSVLGLSGAQARSSGRRPRGVLLLVGPTGTGKTELAKALTETVFGEGAVPLRFDMSEFGAEHAEARLMGAPPGYVGYDAGGELTNAIRRQPFSLVLFDEIDKAHPRILDKFLQILDEGRLTDGRGATVSFQEAILVFTSNAGMRDLNAEITAAGGTFTDLPTYDVLRARLEKAVDQDFHERLGRPELLNRFGQNIVFFDFIRPDVGREIFDGLVGHVFARVESETGARVKAAPEVLEALASACIVDPLMGGRGIANMVESNLVNPLARALFDARPAAGDTYLLTSWSRSATGVAAIGLESG